ncbi:hypothetical protein KQI84_10595 [bacterium]|nr:hypothetical protein [bacterium]
MSTKHIVLIHGRSVKPRREEKWKLVKEALLAGLERVDQAAADAVREGTVRLSFAYYGDVNNDILIEAEQSRKSWFSSGSLKDWMVPDPDGTYYVPARNYRDGMDRLLGRPTEEHKAKDYGRLLEEYKDLAGVDNLASILSPALNIFGLSDRVLTSQLPDMGRYMLSRVIGSKIRQRLQGPLLKAMNDGDDIALVAHSMGCIVSYDVLWKFSRMSEYQRCWDKRISLFMTLGNPMGEPAIKRELYDANEPADGKYPRNIDHWLNISAYDDFVAHDEDISDDFKEMRSLGQGIPRTRLENPKRIYTFWAGNERGNPNKISSNPHKFYGYLNHPYVAKRLVKWIEQ